MGDFTRPRSCVGTEPGHPALRRVVRGAGVRYSKGCFQDHAALLRQERLRLSQLAPFVDGDFHLCERIARNVLVLGGPAKDSLTCLYPIISDGGGSSVWTDKALYPLLRLVGGD